jgi:hypothetical protein
MYPLVASFTYFPYCRGEYYLSISEQIIAVCKKCISEQGVQVDAIAAAVSNLRDHYNTTKQSFESTQEKLISRQQYYRELLEGFDAKLDHLGSVPLHPSLVAAVGGPDALRNIAYHGFGALTGMAASASASTGARGVMGTAPGVSGVDGVRPALGAAAGAGASPLPIPGAGAGGTSNVFPPISPPGSPMLGVGAGLVGSPPTFTGSSPLSVPTLTQNRYPSLENSPSRPKSQSHQQQQQPQSALTLGISQQNQINSLPSQQQQNSPAPSPGSNALTRAQRQGAGNSTGTGTGISSSVSGSLDDSFPFQMGDVYVANISATASAGADADLASPR